MVIGYDFEAENNPAITFCRKKGTYTKYEGTVQ